MTTSVPDAGCAVQRLLHAEPLAGTAPAKAASWLLLEHPGPWPHPGWPADLAAPLADLLARAADAGVRPQLERPVRARRSDRTTVVVASTRPGAAWAEARELTGPDDVAGLDLAAVADGRAPGFGAPLDGPLVLVCTHAKRDVCCARRGRPLAAALDALLPGRVWETTHVGGDRFAPNVVSLPDGSYHGGLDVDDAPALAAALADGDVLPSFLRGTAGRPGVLQAAECFVRVERGLGGRDAVRALRSRDLGGDVHCVDVAVTGVGVLQVEVVRRRAAEPRLTSCAGGGTTDRPAAFARRTSALAPALSPA